MTDELSDLISQQTHNMRPEFDIARCRCPRCVTMRRLRLPSVACLCITSVCIGYVVFEFSNPKRFELPNLAPASKTLPPSGPSTPAIQAQPSHRQPRSNSRTQMVGPCSRPTEPRCQ